MAKGKNKNEDTAVATLPTGNVEGDLPVPDYMRQAEPEGVGAGVQYDSMPFLKVIQAQTSGSMKEDHGVGSLVVLPDAIVAAEYEKTVDVCVFFKWISYLKIRDNKDKEFFIAEETLDAESDLAKKSRRQDTRSEAYPNDPKMFYKNHKAFNFVVEIHSGLAKGMIAAIRLHGGGFKHGQQWWNRIERAGEQGVPVYGLRWLGLVKHEVGTEGEWEQLRIVGPGKDAFVPEEDMARLSKYFADAKKALDEGTLGFAKVDEEDN